ncbi:6-carboxytetrahydropterin synthase QueD [Thermaurantimonas aggregans]|uniref:6-carboxy-5,6,7,8-tetrahydropterin synthase n=1 Tax=Thermaurantimonas aggregans TaxID=2173829 RepID=A0A401XK35_9FLAO|nr:6-carboxytetrahydropterin synthase [Thermaurantimonas aggregans]MCX8148547.1 6-carboxytetrahydropterin synthase [Thermaurantimonas aggregans]GCD77379.1 6-carboxytetrahydropterin synthase QueD [Thermaurantimonas aggregans]
MNSSFVLHRRFYFEAAHFLPDYLGDCRNIHGHSYVLEIGVSGKIQISGSERGMIIDLKRLKALVQTSVLDVLDHALIVEKAEFSNGNSIPADMKLVVLRETPTVENLLKWIITRLTEDLPEGIRLEFSKLHETRDSWVEWRAGSAVFSR